MNFEKILENFLVNKDIEIYLNGNNSHTTTRHEAWMKATTLSNLAMCQKLDKLIDLFSNAKEEKNKKQRG